MLFLWKTAPLYSGQKAWRFYSQSAIIEISNNHQQASICVVRRIWFRGISYRGDYFNAGNKKCRKSCGCFRQSELIMPEIYSVGLKSHTKRQEAT